MKYDAFTSYAGEDTKLASEIVGGLKSRGFKIWYAPIDLKVGAKLLDSIETGMRDARAGILLISKNYLRKGWTNYEMDTLLRQAIEQDKKTYPIWHEVTKEEIETRHPGLAGIVSLKSEIGLHLLVSNLTEAMVEGAPTTGYIPSYESPKWRFLQGRGEVVIGSVNGPATSMWELLLHLKDTGYPFYLDGELFTKEDLLLRAAHLLPHLPDVVKRYVGSDGYKKLCTMCREAGLTPNF